MRVIRSVLILAATTLMCSAYGQSQPSLKGVILDISGAVLPSATVRLFSIDQLQETKSDENGEFRFTSLAPGTYELQASSSGFATATIENVLAAIGDKDSLKLSLKPLGTSADCGKQSPASYEVSRREKEIGFSGVVTDIHGAVLPRAELYVSRLGETRVAATQRANEKGEFTFPNLEPGKYTLSGSLKGYSPLLPASFWVTRGSLTKVTFLIAKERLIVCH